jgi:hypothetical protein
MVRTGGLLCRCAIVVTVVVVGLTVGERASAQRAAPSGPRAAAVTSRSHLAADCRATRITGVTENRTGIGMRVKQYGNGLGTEWCRVPEDLVRAHSTSSWLAGDSSAEVSVNIVYLLDNGDEVLFFAQISKARGSETGCSFVQVVRTPREYECSSEVVASAPTIAFVRFFVSTRAAGKATVG